MKRSAALVKLCITAGFLSLFLFNAGSLRCESPPGGPDNLPPQAKRSVPELGKTRDQSWLEDQQDKNERFKVLEWMIMERLQQQYQKMEIREELEDNAD